MPGPRTRTANGRARRSGGPLVRDRREAAEDQESARDACSVGEVTENAAWRVREGLPEVDSQMSELLPSVRTGKLFTDVA